MTTIVNTGTQKAKAIAAHCGEDAGKGSGISRNGAGKKTLRTDQGDVTVEVTRDRNGTFEPKLVNKHQRSFKGFDDKI